ncbi:PIN/TRAM domain-containing protein [soil metagenome]
MSDENRRHVARYSRARIMRYLGLLVGAFIGWQIGARIAGGSSSNEWGPAAFLFGAVIGGILFILAPYLILGTISRLRRKFSTVPAIDIVAAGVGLVVGGMVSSLLAFPVSVLPNPYGQILPFIVALIACSLSVFVVVLRKRDLSAIFLRNSDRIAPTSKLLLDTSVIIDGRILDLMRTGIVTMPLAVPGFVLRELQGIADSSDSNRKVRGRRGLDILERLQREDIADLEIIEVDVAEELTVDNKLIRLAMLSHYHVFTGDQNLEKVAKVQGVQVVNINALAQSLRPPVVAGEELEIEIVQPGRESGQGIGFLDDGTLVVVEDAKNLVGEDVRVVVTRTLQTGTGRMAFAQIKNEEVVA